jgi:hypothetical protein
MFRYQCHTCGGYHEGMPSFGWEYPMQYLAVPEGERPTRIRLTSDTCVIDNQWFFVRGCLEIPVHDHAEPLVYGVWVSLSEKSFATYQDAYDVHGRERYGPFFGWLTAVPPPFPDALLKSMLHLRPVPTRPYIELEPTDHPLAVAQKEGISAAKVQEIAERLLHGDQTA